jgi:hypothetical protein
MGFLERRTIMAVAEKLNGRRMLALEEVSNGAEGIMAMPYRIEVEIEGTTPILFHRWNCEAVEEKSKAAKGSDAKKTDNVNSYVYRTKNGKMALPGEYLRMACVWAAKFRQDPRSPRKSAMDLFKAGLVVETELAPITLGGKSLSNWSYIDQRRVVIQRNGITRQRPAVEKGWRVKVIFLVLTPEYIDPQTLRDVITQAGKLVGVGDFRPSYGRFQVCSCEILS